MISDWLAALAASGAAALLGAAATDAWQSARAGLVTVFRRRGRSSADNVEQWLDDDARTIAEALPAERDEVRRQLTATWQARLLELLRQHPEAAEDLRGWAAEVASQLPTDSGTWLQTNLASGNATQNIVQHGTLNVYGRGDR